MKVTISSSVASLEIELSEEQAFELFDTALGFVGKKFPRVPLPQPLQKGGVIPKTQEINDAVKEAVGNNSEPIIRLNGVPLQSKPTFKGFLYLQCEECKKFKGFMPKSPISEYRCDCGHTTSLKDMRSMYVTCECGQKFKYLTNATDDVISIDCYRCGSPIDLEYHSVKNNYQTIGG